MAQKFGLTWWGEQWLHSLSNIDYSNRLPRGATYARKGAVVDVEIKDNLISAKVKGARPTPYRVKISIPKFTHSEIYRLIDEVQANPTVLAQLLNRELNPQIMEIAGRLGLRIFPKSWKDFEMDCSCPDYAVPCKHLAAVIYMVSREIDNNPFLILKLRCALIRSAVFRGCIATCALVLEAFWPTIWVLEKRFRLSRCCKNKKTMVCLRPKLPLLLLFQQV